MTSRKHEFEKVHKNAQRIWNAKNMSLFEKVRLSPIIRFHNQGDIENFKRAVGFYYAPFAHDGRRLRLNTNYVYMKSHKPFYPITTNANLNFPLNTGYYSSSLSKARGLANKNNVYRVAQNLSTKHLNNEMKQAKKHIAAAKVAQILGNAVERRRQLKNYMVFLAGLKKVRKYNSPERKRQTNGQRIATARRRVSIITRHTKTNT